MIKFAYEELNIGAEFFKLTFKEYHYLAEGYYKRQEIKWLHTRDIVAKIHNTNAGKISEQRTPQQLYPLQIDKELDKLRAKEQSKRKKILSGKKYEEAKRKFERVLNKNSCRAKAT